MPDIDIDFDPEGRERFFETLKNLNTARGVTIIMITHDIGTIGQHASHLLYLDKNLVGLGIGNLHLSQFNRTLSQIPKGLCFHGMPPYSSFPLS